MKRAVILDTILNKHPEWLSEPVDHTNPSNWTGVLLCKNLTPSFSWDCGKNVAKNVLPKNILIDLIPDATGLKPKGEYKGVTDDDDDNIIDVSSGEDETNDGSNDDDTAYTEFEDLEESNHPHEITVSQDGRQMDKATVLRLITSSKGFRKSNDRLRRVAGFRNSLQTHLFYTILMILGHKTYSH